MSRRNCLYTRPTNGIEGERANRVWSVSANNGESGKNRKRRREESASPTRSGQAEAGRYKADCGTVLEGGQVLIEVGYGLDAAEIVLQIEMFVGGVGVFVGKAEAHEYAGDFKGVVHLGDEGNGAAFADEDGFFLKALFESGLGALEKGCMVRSGPGVAAAEDFAFA